MCSEWEQLSQGSLSLVLWHKFSSQQSFFVEWKEASKDIRTSLTTVVSPQSILSLLQRTHPNLRRLLEPSCVFLWQRANRHICSWSGRRACLSYCMNIFLQFYDSFFWFYIYSLSFCFFSVLFCVFSFQFKPASVLYSIFCCCCRCFDRIDTRRKCDFEIRRVTRISVNSSAMESTLLLCFFMLMISWMFSVCTLMLCLCWACLLVLWSECFHSSPWILSLIQVEPRIFSLSCYCFDSISFSFHQFVNFPVQFLYLVWYYCWIMHSNFFVWYFQSQIKWMKWILNGCLYFCMHIYYGFFGGCFFFFFSLLWCWYKINLCHNFYILW